MSAVLLVGVGLTAAGAGLLERLRRHRQILDQQKSECRRNSIASYAAQPRLA